MSPERDPPDYLPGDLSGEKEKKVPEVILEQYERTYCDCSQCTTACKTMPGSLAPGDFEEIAKYMRARPDTKLLEENFVASDGPLVRVFRSDGAPEDLHIPTIVPRQEDDGRCVFLDEDDHCMIHPAAPFGCRMYKVCDPPSMEDDVKSANMLRVILRQPTYLEAWKHLCERGLIAKPLLERRQDMAHALKNLEESS
jgi:Fe-S-cluster containining protein